MKRHFKLVYKRSSRRLKSGDVGSILPKMCSKTWWNTASRSHLKEMMHSTFGWSYAWVFPFSQQKKSLQCGMSWRINQFLAFHKLLSRLVICFHLDENHAIYNTTTYSRNWSLTYNVHGLISDWISYQSMASLIVRTTVLKVWTNVGM